MNILICPNAFKGALDALKAAKAISEGFQKSKLKCVTEIVPIADGGDGSLPVIAQHLNAELIVAMVSNPLGDLIEANYGFIDREKMAIIEMAEASGIRLVAEDQLNPWRLTSFGTGELIRHAVERGSEKIYLTLGGSATVDGAIGLLSALGALFVTKNGEVLESVDMKIIREIETIDIQQVIAFFGGIELIILSDVTNPLLGKNGAASVFGPQKGLQKEDIPEMEDSLHHLAKLIKRATGVEIEKIEGGGAAGGIAATLYGLFGATITSGGEQILKWSNFDEKLKVADLLITGEGEIDEQTAFGKGPGLVAGKAQKKGVPVIGLCGAVKANQLEYNNFDAVFPITNMPMRLSDAMTDTAINLERTAYQIGNMIFATASSEKL